MIWGCVNCLTGSTSVRGGAPPEPVFVTCFCNSGNQLSGRWRAYAVRLAATSGVVVVNVGRAGSPTTSMTHPQAALRVQVPYHSMSATNVGNKVRAHAGRHATHRNDQGVAFPDREAMVRDDRTTTGAPDPVVAS